MKSNSLLQPVLFSALLLAISSFQELHAHETLLLWPEDPELNSADGMGTELEKRGKMRMQGVKSPHLRLYPAPKSSQPNPAILHVPGGGYKTCVTGIHEPIAAWFAEQGIRPFMLIYRCPAEKDAKEPLQDIQRAIRILRAHAKKWNIDPDRIGVIGSSAGGNLSVRASVFADQDTYPRKDEIDQFHSKPDFSILMYPAWVGSRTTGEVNSWVKVTGEFGPTFITAAKDDKHFGSSPPYEKALKAAGVPVEALYFETGGHGFSLREPEAISTWPEECLKWLKKNKILP
jgi:acetyl esterase/lipase